MREKIARRLHTRDRSIMKVLYESAPLNVSWDALTWTQRAKYLKDANLYVNDFTEEIEKVENPYPDTIWGAQDIEYIAFEECRQAILSLFRPVEQQYCTDCNGEAAVPIEDCPRYKQNPVGYVEDI